MKFQPTEYSENAGALVFNDAEESYKIYLEDYPCPYGEPGDAILFCAEGNPTPFHQAKVCERSVCRLDELTDDHIRLEGALSRAEFLNVWDKIYGETQDAAQFNPWGWLIRWL